MRHHSLLRTARLSVALALLSTLALPGIASADPPLRFTETVLSIDCPFIQTEEGAVGVFAFTSDLGFTELGVVLFAGDPPDPELPPLLDGFTDQATVDGLTIGATVPLFDAIGTEVGVATLDATLIPIGEPEVFEEKNPHFRIEGSFQSAAVEGGVVIEAEGILDAPLSVDLSVCSGSITVQTVFEVVPGTIQDRHDETNFSCELANADATASLFGFSLIAGGEPQFGFIDAFVSPNDPSVPLLVGGVEAAFGIDGVEASWELFDELTGEVIGAATLSASFEPTGVELGTRVGQNYRQKITATTLAVSGTFSVETATATYEFDLAACEAAFVEFHNMFHSPAGPKAGGAVPANDTPDGAVALEVGDKIQMKTGGASLAPEEPCVIEFFGELLEAPMGRTVWFAVEGTGDPITIDPSGSNYDTVVGAYVAVDGGLEQVACVDDDFESLIQPPQSPLTFDTVEGTTYYIQVGGFDQGTLFGEEPNPEFGLLKLKVR